MSKKNNYVSREILDSLCYDAIEGELEEEMLHYQKMSEEKQLYPSANLNERINVINRQIS